MIRRIGLIVLGSVVLLGIWLRTYELGNRGIVGSDTVYYASLAAAWVDHGEPQYSIGHQIRVYRPVPFSLYALSYLIFGTSDATLKWVNVVADAISVVLVFWIGSILCRDALPALCATASYSFLPRAIEVSRQEFVHSISTTLVLLAVLLFLLQSPRTSEWKRAVLLACSGLTIGLAVLSHEELIFIAPAFVVCSFFGTPRSGSRWRAKALEVLLFSSCVVAVSIRGILEQIGPVVRLAGLRPGKTLVSVEPGHVFVRFLHDSIVANGSVVLSGLFVGLALLAGIGSLRSICLRGYVGTLSWPQQLPGLIVIGYTLFCALALRFYPVRVFLPMMPLVLIAIFVYLSVLPGSRFRVPLWASALALILVANLTLYGSHLEARTIDFREGKVPGLPGVEFDPVANLRSFRDEVFCPSWPRQVYDRLADKVSNDSTLLVTPAIAYSYPGRRVFQLECYFGDNAVYVVDHEVALSTLVRDQKIRYVLFSTQHLDRRLESFSAYRIHRNGGKWRYKKPFVLGAVYGFQPGEYSLQAEWIELRRFLATNKARLIASSPNVPPFESLNLNSPPGGAHWIFELPNLGRQEMDETAH